jgi:hypothetical protein
MGIVMGDSVGHRCWSRLMASTNTSDHFAKVLWRCDRPRGMGECDVSVEFFGKLINDQTWDVREGVRTGCIAFEQVNGS